MVSMQATEKIRQKAKALRDQGKSLEEITAEFKRLKIKSRRGKPYSAAGVDYLLKNKTSSKKPARIVDVPVSVATGPSSRVAVVFCDPSDLAQVMEVMGG